MMLLLYFWALNASEPEPSLMFFVPSHTLEECKQIMIGKFHRLGITPIEMEGVYEALPLPKDINAMDNLLCFFRPIFHEPFTTLSSFPATLKERVMEPRRALPDALQPAAQVIWQLLYQHNVFGKRVWFFTQLSPEMQIQEADNFIASLPSVFNAEDRAPTRWKDAVYALQNLSMHQQQEAAFIFLENMLNWVKLCGIDGQENEDSIMTLYHHLSPERREAVAMRLANICYDNKLTNLKLALASIAAGMWTDELDTQETAEQAFERCTKILQQWMAGAVEYCLSTEQPQFRIFALFNNRALQNTQLPFELMTTILDYHATDKLYRIESQTFQQLREPALAAKKKDREEGKTTEECCIL